LVTISANGCPTDWLTHDQGCFFSSSSIPSNPSLTYDDAKKYCSGKGGHLFVLRAFVTQNDRATFLTSIRATNTDYFIGLRKNSAGNWLWDDGVQADSNPITGSGSCAMMGAYGQYNIEAVKCTNSYKFVCGKKKNGKRYYFNIGFITTIFKKFFLRKGN
jgi:hypothetical protein